MSRPPTLARLSPAEADRLREAPYTYPEVGATLRGGDLPDGYGLVHRSARVGDADDLDALADRLLHWEVQRRSGLRLTASSALVEPRAVVVQRLGLGPLSLRSPCRVVDVVDEPDRRGFAYGTLAGHAETGEELFVLERRPDGTHLVVTAFSRPATLLARVGGPVSTAVQGRLIGRYLRALT